MKKNTIGINLIKYGEFHTYYPLKFDTDLSFENLCTAIAESSFIFKEEYSEKILHTLGVSLAQTVEEFTQNYSSSDSVYLKIQDFEKYKSTTFSPLDLKNQELRIELDDTGNSLKIAVINTELEALENRIRRIQDEYEHSSQYYGQYFVNSHERFLLLPLKIELNSKENVWLFAILYVFSNKMGVLKLELPLINVDSKPLKNNDVNPFISKTHCTWKDDFSSVNTLDEISKFYINALHKKLKISIWQYNDTINHIILADFDGVPSQINNIPDILQEDIFRIICAPVSEMSCTSYKKDAKEYLRDHSWGNHNVKYVLKSTGGCLSFVDQALLDYVCEKFKDKYRTTVLTESDYFYICNQISRDLQNNAELALLIVILKKANNHNTIIQKINAPQKLTKIQNEYWENIKFICQLQEGCYGSVSEQISIFENMMPYYTKQKITDTKLSAIDNILNNKRQEQNNNFQNFIAIGGLLLAIFWGLPSIYDTLKLLKDFFAFIPQNIPYISINNCSIFLWLVLNVAILVRIFKK